MAEDFDDILRSVLAARRPDSTAPTDVTGQLLRVEVHGRRLTDAEIMSVLRNWTGADRHGESRTPSSSMLAAGDRHRHESRATTRRT